ncbi:heme peroxidase [Pholiota conissans]|uniref:Peroxidase n=1 Tax=Pholiota conissans TaxID=109636 RepID=A0A9P5Z625_9AGAR|nr:heme peroxidase [Pholiota conissans]
MLPLKERIRLAIVASAFLSTVAAYTWPSPQYDALEEFLYEGIDKTGVPIATLASGCLSRLFNGGPTINAEWLRLAYHDMATHNITDGTGGLDASIYYELLRAENVGAGMKDTLVDFRQSFNKYVSRADVLAMGAIWGVAGCSGPPIRYRGGRKDASGAGRPGVPEPQQDLQSHKDSFKLQGFNETEMIALVACGHTVGAVRAADFPTIVADKKGTNPTVGSFDTTTKYDNVVVTEYLRGTTKNPLVVNANTTVLSDLRIFSSDGNVTMKRQVYVMLVLISLNIGLHPRSMQSPSDFAITCQNLLERMLNTVPADVQLTDEITLLPFKVKVAELIVNNTDVIFNAIARVSFFSPSNSTRSLNYVKLFWCDRIGPNADCADGTANFANNVGSVLPGVTSPLTDALNTSFQSYHFHTPVAPTSSVAKFWFGVLDSGKAAKDTVLQANGGDGYLIPHDMVISVPELGFASTSSSLVVNEPAATDFGMVKTNTTPSLVEMRIYDNNIAVSPGGNVTIPDPLNFTTTLKPLSLPSVGGYNFWVGNFSDALGQSTVDFAVEVDGRRYELDFVQSPLRFGPISGLGGDFSKVGKVNLTEAMTGGQVNTTVGSNGNGTLVAPGGSSSGGSGVGGSSGAIKLSFGWTLLAGVLATLVGFGVG